MLQHRTRHTMVGLLVLGSVLLAHVAAVPAAQIHVHYNTGFGNFVAIRGSGAGLNWTTGQRATWTTGNVWVYNTPSTAGGFQFKPLFNDATWSVGANYVVPSGNSVVHVYPFYGPSRGTLQTISNFYSQRLQNQRNVYVYLPPSYFENTAKRYPVLYMHDGKNLFEPAKAFGGVAWEVDATIDRLVGEGRMREVIVVGIDNTAARMSEYTPVPDPDYGGGNGETYLDFIEFELMPYINTNYRTITGRENTLIGGSSLGGLISFWASWTRSDVFSTAVCMSSSFWWSDRFEIDEVASHTGAKIPSRFYIDAGGINDGAADTTAMRDTLQSKGYQHDVDLFHWFEPSGAHNEASWAARFYRPMERLLPFQ
ncbi:MAG TPA: alpha/beta hydrolase-fold protein [Haliangium sp.]|nr:alpha/beta hydrolase-fold protein [Haliangium sp.]